MTPIFVLVGLTAGWMIYLAMERWLLERHREAIPLRIAVTGTRGKTSVTRRLASVLARDGRRVLAKTTGSEATYLFPDGSQQEIHRLGVPSIIEQKHLLRRGARLGVDVVVAEVMSLHAENHRVEIGEILRPHLVLVTNFRVDHLEAQGRTRTEVASVLALDVPAGSRALVPEGEVEDVFLERVASAGGEVEIVPAGEARLRDGTLSHSNLGGFGSNLDLVWRGARALGVGDTTILEGLAQAQDDIGALKVWRYRPEVPGPEWLLVNAFAANDPESTLKILDQIVEEREMSPERCTGLLSLRSDRGDRSAQWVDALLDGALDRFGRLFVAGLHSHAVRHRLKAQPGGGRIEILRKAPPEGAMKQILQGGTPGGLVFGFGNIGGLGRLMVQYWDKVGEAHGV